MDELAFWKQKIVQAFHDPPGKPYAFFPGAGGHMNFAKQLFKRFTAEDFRHYARRPDLAASGADRPVMNGPRGVSELQPGIVYFHRDGNNVVTHPLARNCTLQLPHSRDAQPDDVLDLLRQPENALDNLGPAEWSDPASLREGFRVLWRRWRDELRIAYPGESLLWERIPGDSRVPDHSIWEHLKVTSALAFLDRGSGKAIPPEKEPWLFTFSLTPVQEFIAESRKSRDLWISSFLLAELAWHAMLPIVERYGPDAIVYPDLRGNPRVDNWLYHAHRFALPERDPYPISHAALLPETFVAILPQGGAGYLRPIEDVAGDCGMRMQQRWRELAGVVRSWLTGKTKLKPGWKRIWDQQHQHPPIAGYWSAVHWQVPGKLDSSDDVTRLMRGGAVPSQDRTQVPPPSAKALEVAQARERRLGVWMPAEVWAHYERARGVFGQVNLGYLQNERGFDYALTHHELRMRQRLRKQDARYRSASAFEERGEKCTQCRQREALYDETGGIDETIDSLRERVRQFWKQKELDEEELGAERLCGVCAFKRFLVEAGGASEGINPLWGEPSELDREMREHGEVHFPFPSTTTIAAQEFLATIAKSTDAAVTTAMGGVIAAHRRTGLSRTLFAETLPCLDRASRTSALAEKFLMIEPQESCFPDALQTQIDRAKKEHGENNQKLRALVDLRNAAAKLRQAAAKARDSGNPKKRSIDDPDTHFAVVMLDGDNTGRLLLGDAEAIGAKWRDVIHPRMVKKLAENEHLARAGWANLLDAPRLMGPSLHAFISRSLADFSHHIVPWVVEQEYGGRLIYCGGDDVLAMLPARDALPMAARLQQLFSAAWIVDTLSDAADVKAWSWRQKGSKLLFDQIKARQRFVIPMPVEGATVQDGQHLKAIELPLESNDVVAPVGLQPKDMGAGPFDGQVLAGLGPHRSLSASVVFGHFKTQLSTMLRRSRWLLEHVAKGEADRSAVALAHHSRGGLKSELVLKWKSPADVLAGIPELYAHELVERVVTAFQRGSLPRKLPYKLREVSPLLLVEKDVKKRRTLAHGLLKHALERKSEDEAEQVKLEQAVLKLWLAGYEHCERRLGSRPLDTSEAERFVEGLLLCRYLAGHGGDSE